MALLVTLQRVLHTEHMQDLEVRWGLIVQMFTPMCVYFIASEWSPNKQPFMYECLE